MNNCLITKLKGIVNNPDLPLFGYLTITRNNSSSFYNNHFVIVMDSASVYEYVTVNFIVEGDWTIKTIENITGNERTYTAGTYSTTLKAVQIEYVSGDNGCCKIDLKSIYDKKVNVFSGYIFDMPVNVFSAYGKFFGIRLSEYSYYEGINKLSDYFKVKDDQGAIGELSYINLFQSNIINDLTSEQEINYFGRATKIENISVNDKTMDPIAIADAQVSHGRTSGTLRIYGSSNKLFTFDPSQPAGYTYQDF